MQDNIEHVSPMQGLVQREEPHTDQPQEQNINHVLDQTMDQILDPTMNPTRGHILDQSPVQVLNPTMNETQPPPQRQMEQRGNKKRSGAKPRCLFKVKLPPFSSFKKRKPVEDKAESAKDTPETPVDGEQSRDGDTDASGRDVFSFSKRTTSKTKSDKIKAKQAVLRTISRMLEENQQIRERLIAFSQTL